MAEVNASQSQSVPLSASQTLAVSASDLKRPSSSASSGSDSQHLSRTRQAKGHYSKAARSFLQKDYRASLIESQHAVNLLASSANLGMSLSASNLLESDKELNHLVEKLAILRLTALASVFSSATIKAPVLELLRQNQASEQTSADVAGLAASINSFTTSLQPSQQLILLLNKEPSAFISHLWFESLRLCSHTSGDADSPSLDPSPETLVLSLELPASVISAAIMAALRLDDINEKQIAGTHAARLISEWYLAAYSSGVGADGPSEKAAAAYEKVVNLYSLHVLAARLGEWEYAREFVGYSSLDEPKKLALLGQVDAAQAHLLTKSERESENAAAAVKAYEQEKAKRAAAEAESKSKGANGLVKGVTDFLRGGEPEPSVNGKARADGSDDASSESGSSKKLKSDYFSPQGGSASSSSTSPATSPGSVKSNRSESSSRDDASSVSSKDGKKRSSSRTSRPRKSSSKSSPGDGDASDATAGSDRSRRRESTSGKNDASYAATRANLSRYLENRPLDGSSPQDARARAVERRPTAASSLVQSLKALFDFRNPQSRSYLFSGLLMLFILYRLIRRPSSGATETRSGKSQGASRGRQESAAARNARNRLSKADGSSDSILGLGWVVLAWQKVFDTIKMGTQVTYL